MINTLSQCTKRGNMLSQAYKGIQSFYNYVCRIIYILLVFFIFPNNTIKIVYTVISIPLVIFSIWAFLWFACALDDKCYYDNVGA